MTVRFGDPRLPEHWWSRIEETAECWLWLGRIMWQGYGHYDVPGAGVVRAHRYAYKMLVDDVGAEWQIDHMCHERHCVNPAHLQAVTAAENQQNRQGAWARNKTGVRGVHWDSGRQKYAVKVCHQYRTHHGGRFDSLEEAAEAARNLRNRLFTNNLADR